MYPLQTHFQIYLKLNWATLLILTDWYPATLCLSFFNTHSQVDRERNKDVKERGRKIDNVMTHIVITPSSTTNAPSTCEPASSLPIVTSLKEGGRKMTQGGTQTHSLANGLPLEEITYLVTIATATKTLQVYHGFMDIMLSCLQ